MVKEVNESLRKRWIVSIRATFDARDRINRAATESGRSITQEIERRLDRTFQEDDNVGGPSTAAFLNLLGATIRDLEVRTGGSWTTNQETWEAVRMAFLREFDERSPANIKANPEALRKGRRRIWPTPAKAEK